MKRSLPLTLLLLFALVGCTLPQIPGLTGPTATPSLTPSPLATATLPPTWTPVASATPAATWTPSAPTLPAIGGLALLSTPVPAVTDATRTQTVIVFLVKLNDNGASGDRIGCLDSLVPVELAVAPYVDPARAALEALFALRLRDYASLYNGLYLSNLRYLSLSVEGTRAVLRLSGEVLSGGVCDDPRITEQIKRTVRHYNPLVVNVTILVDGRDLSEILSLKGK